VHLIERPAVLLEKIDCLRPLHGAERIDRWRAHASEGRWKDLVADLLDEHYDPAYKRSMYRNYQDAQTATPVTVTDVSGEGFMRIAREISAKLG
jgi:tRNA 2-selenouridine synthase